MLDYKPKAIRLFHPVAFEKWDYDTPWERGIGGSETSQVELAWRLARRGWDVTSYAPVPWTGSREWRGTTWRPLEDADFSQDGIWLIYRHPETLDGFANPHPNQQIFFIAQDAAYPNRWNPERIARLDGMCALCQSQAASIVATEHGMSGKVVVTSNGIRPEQFRELDKYPPEREPYRLMWATSPDRGLLNLAKIFRRLKEWIPKATLAVFYGVDNLERLIELQYPGYREMVSKIMAELQQPGIEWRGRIPQKELASEWAKSSVFCYPTSFTETSCISIMEAQAAGCIPVVSPVWALAENIKAGGVVYGDPNDPMTQARFVGEIYRVMSKPQFYEPLRKSLAASARVNFNWERVVDGLENHFLQLPENPGTHYTFQLKHAKGKVLNIGCDEDPCKFGERGATNVDIAEANPVLGYKTAAHVIADVRQPLPVEREYDTAILGDVIEHIREEEIPAAIHNAAQAVKPGGQLIVTFPDDTRTIEEQAMWNGAKGSEHYGENSHALHDHRMDIGKVKEIIQREGLTIEKTQDVDYGLYMGYAILARTPAEANGAATNLWPATTADLVRATDVQPLDTRHRFILYSPIHMEEWDWTHSRERGIGGCETSIVEMAVRLASLGHEVIVYTKTPWHDARQWCGTTWRHYTEADFTLAGTWVLYRCPDVVHKLKGVNQTKWLMMQDWDYTWIVGAIGAIDKFDCIAVLCETHKRFLVEKHPAQADKLWVTSNGVRVDLIEQIEKDSQPPLGIPIERNPRKIMFASSPDRGLKNLLSIFAQAQDYLCSCVGLGPYVKPLSLHVFYGFDGVEKLVELYPQQNARMLEERDEIVRMAAKIPGVFLRGRVTPRELYSEWLSAGMLVYPSDFAELSFITGQEAQCMGAIPIVTDAWAQSENTLHGVKIPGDPSDPLVQKEFVRQIVHFVGSEATRLHGFVFHQKEQERIRPTMMAEARQRCNWDRFAEQWSQAAMGCVEVTHCRGCGADEQHLADVLDLREQAIAGHFPV